MTRIATAPAAYDGGPAPRRSRSAARSANVQFWALNVAGFLALGNLYHRLCIYWAAPRVLPGGAHRHPHRTPAHRLLRALPGRVWSTRLWKRLLVMVTGSYVVALLGGSKYVALVHFYGPHFDPGEMKYDSWLSTARGAFSSFIILCWTGLYVGIKYYRMLGEERARALRAINSAREAQLRMLRYQLNPHFLFNTLNAISTLILEQETRQANGMVTRLSSFLRHSLDSDPMQKVTRLAGQRRSRPCRLYLEIETGAVRASACTLELVERHARGAAGPDPVAAAAAAGRERHQVRHRPQRGRAEPTHLRAARVAGGEHAARSGSSMTARSAPDLRLESRRPQGGGAGATDGRERLQQPCTAATSWSTIAPRATDPHVADRIRRPPAAPTRRTAP
ncbi:MAG: histidine kinase [Gammaproteobacteria bacterium]|nr:histidine kinase [Gammaproteobacteria bacterium]